MKGIILAGGIGTRLYPLTESLSKHLLPVYDKPMIYYPLSILMLMQITDILVITKPEDTDQYKKILGNGSKFGIKLTYATQSSPEGIAQAFIIGEEFIGKSNVCLILGDNIFWGHGLSKILQRVRNRTQGATIFGYQVKDAHRFGVIEFDDERNVTSLEEKPKRPKSNFAVTGLYVYDNQVVKMARQVMPSSRGELEITSVNQMYLQQGNLSVELLGRGFAWLDTGTHESLLQANLFVETLEKRQGYKIACLEEIAWNNQWITDEMLREYSQKLVKTPYGEYLASLLE